MLKTNLSLLLAGLLLAPLLQAAPTVEMKTSLGRIVLELDEQRAPQSVENFKRYVREGFYNGTVFHRVIPRFMIQGGGFTPDMRQKATHPPVRNEAGNGLKNLRGTLAMARTSDPHSATAQFFINHRDNAFLDHPGQDGWGYTVFGRVTEGLDVVDRIAATATGVAAGMPDVPQKPVIIQSATILSEK